MSVVTSSPSFALRLHPTDSLLVTLGFPIPFSSSSLPGSHHDSHVIPVPLFLRDLPFALSSPYEFPLVVSARGTCCCFATLLHFVFLTFIWHSCRCSLLPDFVSSASDPSRSTSRCEFIPNLRASRRISGRKKRSARNFRKKSPARTPGLAASSSSRAKMTRYRADCGTPRQSPCAVQPEPRPTCRAPRAYR
jgi:hypothetical protein